MSKYNKQNRLDEKAVSVISDYFMNLHGDKFDLQFHGIKDNTPDTDGFLRLREPDANTEMNGDYLNNVVFFQLKGFEKNIENHSYVSTRKLVNFCKEINLPTILFIVSNLGNGVEQKEAQIFWYHFSNVNVEILNLINKGKGTKVKIPNLNTLKTGRADFVDQFYQLVKNLSKRNDFLDLPKEILNIAVNLKDRVLQVASIIYLAGRVSESERRSIAELLKITEYQMREVLQLLHQQGLVHKSGKTYVFKLVSDGLTKDIGRSLLYETINKINLKEVKELFKEHEKRKQFFANLGEIRHPVVFEFLNKEAENALAYVEK